MATDIRQGPGRFGTDLTARERFIRTMHYQTRGLCIAP